MTWPAAATREWPNAADRESPAAAAREWPTSGPTPPPSYALQGASVGDAPNSLTGGTGYTYYGRNGQSRMHATTSEDRMRLDIGIAGTFSRLGMLVPSNTLNGSIVTTFRKNVADGNGICTVTAGQTGILIGTGEDAVVVGDDVAHKVVKASGMTGAATYQSVLLLFSAATGHGLHYQGGAAAAITAGLTRYAAIAGFYNVTTAEGTQQLQFDAAGTFSRLQVTVTANTRADDTTATLRINGANTTCTVTIPAATTGHFIDTTNDDTNAVGDLVAVRYVTGAGAGSITVDTASVAWLASSGRSNPMFAHFGASALNAAATTYYIGILGCMGGSGVTAGSTTESDVAISHGFAGTSAKMRIRVAANALAGAQTITFRYRVGGANGNQTVVLASGVTGFVSDESNTDAFSASDLCCVSWVRSAGTTGQFMETIQFLETCS